MSPASHASPRTEAPRILHIVASGGLYGIERMLLALLPELRARAWDAELACLGVRGRPGAEVGAAAAALGVPVRYARFARGADPRGMLDLVRLVVGARPDVLHLHGYKATILAAPLGLVRGIPTVGTLHAEAKQAVGVGAYVTLEGYALRRMRRLAAVSDAIRDELVSRGVPPDRIEVVPNGITGPAANGVRPAGSRDGPTVVAVGRLIPEKNVEVLLEAVRRLRGEFPGIRLLVAGDGPLRDLLAGRARDLGIAEAVTFLGYVDDVPALLAAADCFVLPSRTEGMPISLLEAMACGAAIVASRVGGIPGIARADREALLVPPGDLEDLTGALRRVLGDRELAARLGAGARERFLCEYTAARMAERYVAFYRGVADPNR